MSKPHLRLVRLSDDGNKSLGVLEVYRHRSDRSPVARFFTLEPPWKENRRSVSCIPVGDYTIQRRVSPKYGLHLHVRGTEPQRNLILVHAGNDVKDTKGCILVGVGTADLDGDRDLEVTQSKLAAERLLALVPEDGTQDATLTVVSEIYKVA